jgi:hypothetical protein
VYYAELVTLGRIFASQKPGYPLQFGRFAAKFRFYPLRVSSSGAVFVINQRCPSPALSVPHAIPSRKGSRKTGISQRALRALASLTFFHYDQLSAFSQ